MNQTPNLNRSFLVPWPEYEFSRLSSKRATSANVRKFRELVRSECVNQLGVFDPTQKPVVLSLQFYTPEESRDLDNLVKPLMDALTGTVYTNDSQVIELHAWILRLSNKPRIQVAYEVLDAERLTDFRARKFLESGATLEQLRERVLRQSGKKTTVNAGPKG